MRHLLTVVMLGGIIWMGMNVGYSSDNLCLAEQLRELPTPEKKPIPVEYKKSVAEKLLAPVKPGVDRLITEKDVNETNREVGSVSPSTHSPINIELALDQNPTFGIPFTLRCSIRTVQDYRDLAVHLVLPPEIHTNDNLDVMIDSLPGQTALNLEFQIVVIDSGSFEIEVYIRTTDDSLFFIGDYDILYFKVTKSAVVYRDSPFVERTPLQRQAKQLKTVPVPTLLKLDGGIPPEPDMDTSRLKPLYESWRQESYKVTTPSAGSVKFTGYFSYQDTMGISRPCRWAGVWFYDYDISSADDYLGYAMVNADGSFESDWIENTDDFGYAGTIDVYVVFIASNGAVSVLDPSGDYYDGWTPQPIQSNVPDGIVDIGSWQTPISENPAWWILQWINDGWSYFRNSGPDYEMPHVEIKYPWEAGAHYHDGGQIHIPDINTARSPDILVHEYAHFAMYTLYGNWFPTTYCPSPHYFNDCSHVNCAWTEGWAYFLPIAVYDSPIISHFGSYTINYENYSGASWSDGDCVEGRVAGALNDLFDVANDGTDQYSGGFMPIFDLVSTQIDNNFNQFWQAWCSAGNEECLAVNAIRNNTIDYNNTPLISGIPDQAVVGESSHNNLINLWNYTSDIECSDSQLDYRLIGSNSCGVSADGHYIDIYPPATSSELSCGITVEVSDGSETATDYFIVTVTPHAPDKVNGVNATDLSRDNIIITWIDVSLETGYRVYRNGTQIGGDRPANATQYTDIPSVGCYNYTVRAFNDGGNGPLSNPDEGCRLPENDGPLISGLSSVSVNEGETTSFDLTVSDPDGDPVTVTALNKPTNSTLAKINSSTWRFTFSPDYTQAGVYTVSFIASDGDLTDTLVTMITVASSNRPPVIYGPSSLSLKENETTSASLSAIDPDGDPINMSVADPPANSYLINTGPSTWSFAFSPDYTQAGTYSVKFIASDGSLTDSLTLAIVVSNVNRTPSITGPSTATVNEGESKTLTLTVIDPDGDQMTVTAINLPGNCTISKRNSSSWKCVFNPDYDQAGSYPITFIVSDGSLADTMMTTITVKNVNRAPEISTIDDVTGPEASTISIDIQASDSDGDLVSLNVGGAPENTTFSDSGNGTGQFSFQPDYTQAGNYQITVTASDGDLSSEENFTVTVTNVNRPPATFSLISPAANALLRSTTVKLQWHLSTDPDQAEDVEYWVFIDRGLDLVEISSTNVQSDTAMTLSDLDEQTAYGWRVEAHDPSDGVTENSGSWRQLTIDDLTPPEFFFGIIPSSVLPFSVDFIVKPSEDLKSYATANVYLGNDTTALTFNHTIASSDGNLYSAKYGFAGSGAGTIVLQGSDDSDNETVDTVEFSGYKINPAAPLYGVSYNGSLTLRMTRQPEAGHALVMSYCPDLKIPFEGIEWEPIGSPVRFVISGSRIDDPIEIRLGAKAITQFGSGANIILFQLESNGWVPLPTWRSTVSGDFVGYADSVGVFLAAIGPPDADLQAHTMPVRHTLYQNVPNPFNAATTIIVEVGEGSILQEKMVTLEVYNVLGQKIKTLINNTLSPGVHSTRWDTSDDMSQPVPSGIYFARLLVGEESSTIKMVLMK